METTMKMSRGLRNNNPGNIVKSAAKWQGEVEGSDSRFCTFNNMTHGYRALLLLLDTYQRKHGCTTLTKIFQRYCPASTQGDDPKRYARNVADFISRHLQTVGQEGWEPDDLKRFIKNFWLHLEVLHFINMSFPFRQTIYSCIYSFQNGFGFAK